MLVESSKGCEMYSSPFPLVPFVVIQDAVIGDKKIVKLM